jgi:hypothetical protein
VGGRATCPAKANSQVAKRLLGVHLVEELGILLRFLEIVNQEFETVAGAHRHQHPARDLACSGFSMI